MPARQKLILKVTSLDHDVSLIQTGFEQDDERFSVVYGEEKKNDLTCIEAAHEFGECIMHSATCAGLLDGTEHIPEQEDFDVTLALTLATAVHALLPNAPHDIGPILAKLVHAHNRANS